MEIKFKKIRIRNFRGLVSFEANLEGRSVRISGANGLGKSSVADAITWVLFGKRTAVGAPPSPSTPWTTRAASSTTST